MAGYEYRHVKNKRISLFTGRRTSDASDRYLVRLKTIVSGGPYGGVLGSCVCRGRLHIGGDGRPWAADPTGRLDDQRMLTHNYTDIRVFDMETLV